ncbi:hypothetical protein [Nitritalea halalkaliphila]|nr:hypothetical protein [Nitritalea halalkaliphila]
MKNIFHRSAALFLVGGLMLGFSACDDEMSEMMPEQEIIRTAPM